MEKGILYGGTLVATFVLTVVILRKLIPYLKSKKMGQKILDIGPRWHKSKEGTPAMGGLSFIIASFIVLAAATAIGAALGVLRNIAGLALVYGYALLNGLIGTVDDRTKFKKERNEGLTPIQKYALQLLAAVIFLAVGIFTGLIPGKANDVLYVPFFGATTLLSSLVFRIFYYVFCVFLLTGMVNAVNLTDGIDGLSSSVTLVVGIAFTILAAFVAPLGNEEGLILSAALIGGCAGFLVYNFHPAKVFMGDTGSLFLGGYVVALAFLFKSPLLIVFFGIVYILETLSVILQVGYFKLTHGKRLFKMSPIHHHFEKCGWSEVKIVSVFSAVALIFAFIGLIGSGLFR